MKHVILFLLFAVSLTDVNAQARIKKYGKPPIRMGNGSDTTDREVQYKTDGSILLVQPGKADIQTNTPPLSSTAAFANATADKVTHPDGGLCVKISGAVSSTVAGYGYTVFPGSGGNHYERDLSNTVLTPEMFGAVVDSTADNTLAINRAIAYASYLGVLYNRKQPIDFKYTYLTDGVLLKPRIRIQGNGKFKKRTDGGTINTNALIRAVETNVGGSYYGTYYDIDITDVTLDGNGKISSSNLVSILFIQNLLIEGVTVARYSPGSFAMILGGKNIVVKKNKILGGAALFEDGIHIAQGSDISIEDNYVEAGDDAIALGIDPASITQFGTSFYDGVQNVVITNNRVKSNRANALSLYTSADSPNAVYFIKNVTVKNLTGSSGVLRNGGVLISDKGSPGLGLGRINNVILDGINLTVGSASHDDTNPYAIWINNVQSVKIANANITTVDGTTATNGFRMVQVAASRNIKLNSVDNSSLTKREAYYITGSENIDLLNGTLYQSSSSATPFITVVSTPIVFIENMKLLNGKSAQPMIEATAGTTTSLYLKNSIFAHAAGASAAYAVNLTTTSLAHLQLEGNDFSGVSGVVDGSSVNQKISIGGITGLASYVVQNNRGLTMDGNLALNRKTQDGMLTIGNANSNSPVLNITGFAGGFGGMRFTRLSGVTISHDIKLENMFSINQNQGATHFATQVSGSDNIIYAGVPRTTTTPRRGIIAAEPVNAGSATNLAGSNLVIRSGLGTGSGTPSAVVIETADAGASGTGQQTATAKIYISGSKVNVSSLPTYADNAAAVTGGLAVGDIYRTSTGELRIRY